MNWIIQNWWQVIAITTLSIAGMMLHSAIACPSATFAQGAKMVLFGGLHGLFYGVLAVLAAVFMKARVNLWRGEIRLMTP